MCALSDRARVACRPETRKKERKKREREKEGRATRDEDRDNPSPSPLPRHPSEGVAREGEGMCARVLAEEERRRDAANAWTRAACSRVYRVANHSRHPRPITYWFFTYDLIHYHSVIYICPARCGFRGFRGFREQGVGERCEGGGGRKKKEKIKGGKNRTCTHEGGEGGVTVLE